MTEALVDRIVDVFQGNVPKELIIFLVSMLPVLELRGGMIAAKLLGVPLLKAFVICYIGNILPIPFILLFIRKIFQFLKRFSGTRKIVEKLEVRSMRQSEKVKRWRNWGLAARYPNQDLAAHHRPRRADSEPHNDRLFVWPARHIRQVTNENSRRQTR